MSGFLGAIFSACVLFLLLIWLFMLYVAIGGKEEKEKGENKSKPRVLVMVPCKGYDIDLEGNLRSALSQDYKNYHAVAIIESKKDSAYKSIKKAGIDYLINDYKCSNCSGKVKSLSSAVKHFRSYDLYCILDSDVYAHTGWLSSLVAAMRPDVGIATSFPIFEPVSGFWSHVKHVWGFVGMGLMENKRTRFGWGGTLLFRKDILGGNKMIEFSESVSDDTALTHIAKRMGYKIAYVPEARPIVKCKETRRTFFEWSTRQTKFAIAVNKHMFYYGVAFYSANISLLISGIILTTFNNLVYIILLLPFIIGLAKTYRRSKSYELLIIPIYLASYFIYPYNLIVAKRMKGVRWRGRYYKIQNK